MPAKKDKGRKINLLPQLGFGSTTTGRVVTWLLGTFRIIVIITEIVVMAAFFSRFRLDAKNNDLNESIQQKQAVIASYAETEKNIKDLQTQTQLFNQITQATLSNSLLLEDIRSSIPDNVVLSNINITNTSIRLSGFSASERDVQQFMVNLQTLEIIDKVTLTELASGQQNRSVYTFDLNADFRVGENQEEET
jgi:Tfp pilus assembly protein PilN